MVNNRGSQLHIAKELEYEKRSQNLPVSLTTVSLRGNRFIKATKFLHNRCSTSRKRVRLEVEQNDASEAMY